MIAPRQGVVIAGRYALLRVLASGGMGSVWVAHRRDLEIDVSVKFMAPALVEAAEARMRFEREAKAAARLRSQHVVRVIEYGVEDGTPYIVMELLKGESLAQRLSREGRLSMRVTAPLVVQICKALRTAHEAGLVHRDLKPANLFLALEDEEEVVKVLDFGIAKAVGIGGAQGDTASGVLLGSVHYMSPEQVRSSRQVDHRSDLWSVGVILYRVLTGRLPFPGTDIGDVLVRVCTDVAPPPFSVAPDLPPQVDEFFACALARDPEHRFQSAMELSEAFSAMALQAPAPALSEPAPAEQAAAAPPAPRPRPALPSAADELTVAVPPSTEVTVGTIPAVQMPERRGEPSVEIREPSAGGGRIPVRSSSWLYVAAAALVVLCGGIMGLRFIVGFHAAAGPVVMTSASAAPSITGAASGPPVTSPTSSAATPLPEIAPPAPMRVEDLPTETNDHRTSGHADASGHPDVSGASSQIKAPGQVPRPPPSAAVGQSPMPKGTPKIKRNPLDDPN